ncbi:uncharacterized protein LOC116741171 [Phocoena sinus]|uniref:uncharacterized protein LOC116741171 n=1 Tax=Phocoena sinus TaxID=42100 RepID=UPI0013C4D1A7|nr:uncharacterized protein LOC116741171 [Phocoena sinus]
MRTRGKALGPGAPCPVRPWRCCQSWWGTGSTVPQELLDKLIKSREANPDAAGPREGQGASGLPVWKARPGHGASPPSPSSRPPGLFNLCQIVLAKVVQALHTQTPADPAQENARLCQEILGCPTMPGSQARAGPTLPVGWRLLPRSRGSSGGSYDAQFYGYLCSKVYSADTFHTHFKQERSLSGKQGVLLAPYQCNWRHPNPGPSQTNTSPGASRPHNLCHAHGSITELRKGVKP